MHATTLRYRGRTIETSDSGMVFVQELSDGAGFWVEDVEAAKVEIDLLEDTEAVEEARQAEERMVTEDFCFICGRCTDHRGEHSMVQLLRTNTKGVWTIHP